MKLNTEQLKQIISEAKSAGFDIGLRDLSYAMLLRFYEDGIYAYRIAFGDNPDTPYMGYANSPKCAFICDYFDRNYPEVEVKEEEEEKEPEEKPTTDEGLSYDEIKRGLEEDLQSLIELRDSKDEDGNPTLEPKEMATVVGRIADIRTRLVERFGTVNKEVEQRVVVLSKYSDICPHCGREIAVDPSHQKLF